MSSSVNQQKISINDISAIFLNTSTEQAKTFQMMRNAVIEKNEERTKLLEEMIQMQETIKSQQEELAKLKGTKGDGKAD